MISEITSYLTTFLYSLFYFINDDEQNNLKKMFGWKNSNFVLFFIAFIILLLSLEYCIKAVKFLLLITTMIMSMYLMYVVW